jgi:AraC-like DNA-binding protein
VGLAEIAESVHSSAPHLSRLFRRETGRTLTEHLQGLRVASAQKRLTESSEGILEIALASGFPTLEHFYRTFKRRVGLTPRAYRRAQRA